MVFEAEIVGAFIYPCKKSARCCVSIHEDSVITWKYFGFFFSIEYWQRPKLVPRNAVNRNGPWELRVVENITTRTTTYLNTVVKETLRYCLNTIALEWSLLVANVANLIRY